MLEVLEEFFLLWGVMTCVRSFSLVVAWPFSKLAGSRDYQFNSPLCIWKIINSCHIIFETDLFYVCSSRDRKGSCDACSAVLGHMVYVCFGNFTPSSKLLDIVMPWVHNRKRNQPTDVPADLLAVPTVLTLKEHMWEEYTKVLQANSTGPLTGKDFSSLAMKKFR